MSEEKKPETPAPAAAPAPAPAAKPSKIGGILMIVLPALFAGGAAFGGTRAAAGHAPAAAAAPAHGSEEGAHHAPGPTVALDPFLLTMQDAKGKSHPMKMTIAIEFNPLSHEDYKPYVPRLRDALLVHVRGMSYEKLADHSQFDKLRSELLESCKKAGAPGAEKVLITDFVIQ